MKIDIEHIKHNIKHLWIWMLRKDVFIYLLFVGLAALFWWGRAMSSQREISIKLPIVYTDTPPEIVFESPLPDYLEITLRDNGRLLRQVQHTKPTITISLADKFEEHTNQLHIPTDILRPKVQDILPGSTTIQQIRPEDIVSPYHIEMTKTVPIVLCAQWSLEDQYQLVEPPILEPAYVNIYGSQAEIDAIKTIPTDSIFIEKISGSVHRELTLCIPAGIRTQITTTTVNWQTEQFTDKSFVIPIEVEGLPSGEIIHLFPKTTTIMARVGISHFSTISAKDFRAICKYPYQTQNSLTVEIICNNPRVTQIRSNIREVEYIIERKQ